MKLPRASALFVATLFACRLAAAPGDLDPAFLTGIGAGLTPDSYPTFDSGTGAVNAVALQSTGRIIAGGNISKFNNTGSLTALKRLNADGTLDSTFNSGGAGLASSGQPEVNALLVAPDDKIYVGGTYSSYNGTGRNGILRLNADGTLDPTFAYVGVTGINQYVAAIARQPDGKIIIGGGFTSINSTYSPNLARLTADGTRDASFTAPAYPTNSAVRAVALTLDGKVYVGGTAYNSSAQRNDPLFQRLNADGTLDLSFRPVFGNDYGAVSAIVALPDGRVIIGGSFAIPGVSGIRNYACFNADGSLATNFQQDAGGNGDVMGLLLLSDGRIAASGIFTSLGGQTRASIGIFNLDGTIDTTFAPQPYAGRNDGYITHFYSLAQQTDGRIVAGGWFNRVTDPNLPTYNLTRFEGDFATGPGQIGFASPGYVVNENNGTVTISVARHGGVTGAVSVTYGTSAVTADSADFTAASGTLSWAAGEGGVKTFTVSITNDSAVESTELAALLLTSPTGAATLSRSAASLFIRDDDSPPSMLIHPVGGNVDQGDAYVFAVAFDSVLAATVQWQFDSGSGFADIPGATGVTYTISVADLATHTGSYRAIVTNANGSTPSNAATLVVKIPAGALVSSFNPNTVLAQVVASGLDPLGNLLLGGYTSSNAGAVVRVTSSGTIDPTFNPAFNSFVFSLIPLPDGSMLVGGNFTTVNSTAMNYFAHINADGSLDPAANLGLTQAVNVISLGAGNKLYVGHGGTQGIKRFTLTGASGTLDNTFVTTGLMSGTNTSVHNIKERTDGKVFVSYTTGGTFNTTYQFRLLTSTGSPDASFTAPTITGGNIADWEILPDGRIVVVGNFGAINGTTARGIAFLKADGSLDTSYDFTIAFVYAPRGIRYLNGRLLVWGQFTNYKDVAVNGLMRLNLDGTLDPTFKVGVGTNNLGGISTVTVMPDQRLFLGGGFSSFRGVSRNRTALIEPGPAAVGFDPALVTVLENVGTVTLTVKRFGSAASAASIAYATVNGTATAGSDFTATSGTLSWNADDATARTFTVSITPDSAVESLENFRVVLSNPIGDITAAGGAVISIVDDDTPVTITQQPTGASLTEGQSLTLTGAATSPTAMTYQWYRNDQAIPSANAATYTVAATGSVDAGTYFLRVTNAAGYIDTNTVTVAIALDPARRVSTFNFTSAISGNVRAIAVNPAGGAYVGGDFSSVPGLTNGRYLFRVTEDGALDTTFNPAPLGSVSVLLRQPDGKLLVGGNFTQIAGVTRGYLARLNADGSHDTAFSTALGTGPNFTVNAIGLLPDGRIVIGGSFSAVNNVSGTSYLALLKADGSLDTTFTSVANNAVSAVAVQPDGKILIGGSFTSYNVRFARIGNTGTLDTTFSGAGATSSSNIAKILVLPDNRIALLGTNLASGADIEIINPDGTVAQNINTTSTFYDVIVQDNGKLLAVGSFSLVNATRIARFSPSGSPATYALDTTFASGAGLDNIGYVLAANATGQVWVGGAFTNYNNVAANRLLKLNGEPVALALTSQPVAATVNPGATLSFSVGATGTSALTYQWRKDGAPLSNGGRVSGADTATLSIANATETDEGQYSVVVSNVTANRTATSQNAEAIVLGAPEILTPPASAEFSASNTITLTATVRGATPLTYEWRRNGQLLANGGRISGADTATLTITNSEVTDGGVFTLTVTNAVGTASTQNFTVSVVLQPGLRVSAFASLAANNSINHILPLPDGGALVAGNFNTGGLSGANSTVSGPYLARVKPNGEIDPTFNVAPNSSVVRLAFAPDGGVIAIGYFTQVNGSAKSRIMRLTPSLTLDTGWTGTVSLTGTLRALAVDSAGRIYLGCNYGGFSSAYLEIAERLNPDGTRDNAFSWGANYQLYHIDSIVIDRQDRALIAGNSMSSVGLARILPSGAQDTTFANTINGGQYTFLQVALQSDGKILVASTGSPGLRRLNDDGTSDNTFTNYNPAVGDLAVTYNDSIVVVGGSVSQNGVNFIARLAPNGAVTTFSGPTVGFNSSPATVSMAETGTLWIGGSFTTYNNQTANNIIALNGLVANLLLTRHPQSATIDPGTNTTFTARAVGTSAITYRWLRNGVELSDGGAISGATTTALTIANAAANHSGSYQLRISNATGGVLTSTAATLIVRDQPVVTAALESLYRTSGSSATFSVGAVGVNPLAYQWNKNGAPIAGATSASYTIGSVSRADAGLYSVTITNTLGSVTSPGAALSVGTMPAFSPVKLTTNYLYDEIRAFAKLPDGRFYASGTFTSINGHNTYGLARFLANGAVDTSFVSPFTQGSGGALAAFPDGRVFVYGLMTNTSFGAHQLVNADGTSATFGSTALSNIVGAAQNAAVGPDGNLYVSYTYAAGGNGRPMLVKLSPTGDVLASFLGDGTGGIYDFTFLSGNRIAVAGNWVKNSVTRYVDILDASFAPDTAFAAALTLNNRVFDILKLSDGDLLIAGQFTTVNSVSRAYLARINPDGTLDTGFLSGLAGPNGNSIAELIPAPDNKILVVSGGAQFNGTTVNQFVRIDETGAIDATYLRGTSPNIGLTGGNIYTAVVRDDGAIVIAGYNMTFKGTALGGLGYLTAPEDDTLNIAVHPTPITQPLGSPVTLTVAARGAAALTFQWYKDNVPLSGATATSYFIPSLSESNTGAYTVVVTSGANTVTSDAAAVAVGTPPVADPFADFVAGLPEGKRGPNDDADGDGASNLLEYALGLNPAVADPDGLPLVTIVSNRLTFAYERVRSDVTYTVETSTDLTTWTATGVDQGTPDGEGITLASVPLDVPSRFLRLKVER